MGKKITFYKVYPEGDKNYCIFRENDLQNIADWLAGANIGFKLIVERVEMTEKQFDKLPEYEG
jgi:hypothetical protein